MVYCCSFFTTLLYIVLISYCTTSITRHPKIFQGSLFSQATGGHWSHFSASWKVGTWTARCTSQEERHAATALVGHLGHDCDVAAMIVWWCVTFWRLGCLLTFFCCLEEPWYCSPEIETGIAGWAIMVKSPVILVVSRLPIWWSEFGTSNLLDPYPSTRADGEPKSPIGEWWLQNLSM